MADSIIFDKFIDSTGVTVDASGTTLDAEIASLKSKIAEMYYEPGSYTLTSLSAYGVVTGGANTCSIYIPLPKWLMGGSDVVATSISVTLRIASGGYVGGASDFNATSYISAAYAMNNGALLQVNIVKSNGWGATNNTPVAGTVSVSFTVNSLAT